jgi:glycosyltransferase involved in cell wall biosynthesis
VNIVAIRERFGTYHPVSMIVNSREGRTARSVTHLSVCSAVDRDLFVSLHRVDPGKITIVPNGVAVSDFDGNHGHQLPRELDNELGNATVLLYTGNTNYQPNAVAVRFLSTHVMPELERRQAGQFRLVLTGGGKKADDAHPTLLNAGRLSDDDLKAVIARADICLSPTMSGSGTRLKILEYMAAGKAVVSTAKGAEGIDCEPNRDMVIAEADRFAAEIMDLAGNGTKREQLGMAARELVTRKYDWDTCIKPLWQSIAREITRQ